MSKKAVKKFYETLKGASSGYRGSTFFGFVEFFYSFFEGEAVRVSGATMMLTFHFCNKDSQMVSFQSCEENQNRVNFKLLLEGFVKD